MDSVLIKDVEAADTAAVISLFEAQLCEHDIHTSVKDIRNVIHSVISNPAFGFMLLVTDEGNSVGVAYAAAHLSVEHGGIIGWLEEIYVLQARRNSGIGSRLLTEVVTRARRLQWRGIELEIVAGHERVASLYLRHGFQPLSRIRFHCNFHQL